MDATSKRRPLKEDPELRGQQTFPADNVKIPDGVRGLLMLLDKLHTHQGLTLERVNALFLVVEHAQQALLGWETTEKGEDASPRAGAPSGLVPLAVHKASDAVDFEAQMDSLLMEVITRIVNV